MKLTDSEDFFNDNVFDLFLNTTNDLFPLFRAAAGLCVATLAADVCGALLTGLGLRAADHRTKFRYYRFAVLAMALARECNSL